MLEVYELRHGKRVSLDVLLDDQQVAMPPFADTSFPLGWLWPFGPSQDTAD